MSATARGHIDKDQRFSGDFCLLYMTLSEMCVSFSERCGSVPRQLRPPPSLISFLVIQDLASSLMLLMRVCSEGLSLSKMQPFRCFQIIQGFIEFSSYLLDGLAHMYPCSTLKAR